MRNTWMAIAGILIGCCGCGQGGADAPTLAECTGTVSYDGKPVAGAVVTFVVEKSPISVATTNSSGKFIVTTGGRKGAPVGMAKVGIAKASPMAENAASMKPEDMRTMQVEAMGKKVETQKPPIPTKYANPNQSGLTADVGTDPAKNVFEFFLFD